MKQAKQRVIAIDYFRGICILMVIMNHGSAFTMPFAYLAGASGLWTSAAEMFLLLSGLTFGIVRGGRIVDDFKAVLRKTLRRAAQIYIINTIVVVLSLTLALMLTAHGLTNDVLGPLPEKSGLSLLWSIMIFSYGIGWASFLMFYSVFLLFAPFALYVLRTRYWPLLPLASAALFMMFSSHNGALDITRSFGLWQVYFVAGMVLARFRVPLISTFYQQKIQIRKAVSTTVMSVAAAFIGLSVLLDFHIYDWVAKLTLEGLFPSKIQHAYAHLMDHKPLFDFLFLQTRTGVLRPLVTISLLAAAYLLYQKHKSWLLSRTGSFVNTLGRDTLWLFVAQAFAIPLLAALPFSRNLPSNLFLTATLLGLMWMVATRSRLRQTAGAYLAELREAYYRGKYAYLYGAENEV